MARSEFNKADLIRFIKEWAEIVELLKRSHIDLSKIKLIAEVN